MISPYNHWFRWLVDGSQVWVMTTIKSVLWIAYPYYLGSKEGNLNCTCSFRPPPTFTMLPSIYLQNIFLLNLFLVDIFVRLFSSFQCFFNFICQANVPKILDGDMLAQFLELTSMQQEAVLALPQGSPNTVMMSGSKPSLSPITVNQVVRLLERVHYALNWNPSCSFLSLSFQWCKSGWPLLSRIKASAERFKLICLPCKLHEDLAATRHTLSINITLDSCSLLLCSN